MKLTIEQARTISRVMAETIRVHVDRLFKSELADSLEYTALIFTLVRTEVQLSLFLAGIPIDMIINQIDPTSDILLALIGRGYAVDGTEGIDDMDEALKETFGPVILDDCGEYDDCTEYLDCI